MPIYEYYCGNCNKVFEEWTKRIEDDAELACPFCATPSKRIVSHTSFVLKGGGWYVTDYGYRKGKDENTAGAGSSYASAVSTPAGGSKAASSSAPAAPAKSAPASTPAV